MSKATRGIPDAIHHTDTSESLEYITGWNDCRAAKLAAQPAPVPWSQALESVWAEEDDPIGDLQGRLIAAQAAQQEPVAWPIETSNQVEALAKQCGWDNRRYMTPADYQIWCDRMREFVQLATPQAQQEPLTDEQIDELARTMVKGSKSVNWLCRAIEAAHGITKGNT